MIAACLTAGLDRNTITATLNDLREQLLYLHYVGRRYRFETKPNLNKLIADEESKVSSDDVLEKIRTELSKLIQATETKSILWAKDSLAIADHSTQFNIVYLAPDWAEKSQESAIQEALIWLERRGNDKRDYKNAIAFVVPNKTQMDKARKAGRTAEAIAALISQKAKYKFTAEDLEELTQKGKDVANEVSAAVRRLYDYVLLPVPSTDSTHPTRLEVLDLQSQLNTSQSLQDRILDALKNHVFSVVTPSKLYQLSGLETSETGYITGEELVSFFFRFPNYPKVLNVEVIRQAVLKAIQQGLMGYIPYLVIPATGEPKLENPALLSFERTIPASELDLSGYLLSPALVKQLLASVQTPPKPEIAPPLEDLQDNDSDSFDPEPTKSSSALEKPTIEYKAQTSSISRTVLVAVVDGKQPARQYKLEAITDKSKIFDRFTVLQTLSDKADDMTIKIEVRASTTKEFEKDWINNAIEEPLDELDIQASTRLE